MVKCSYKTKNTCATKISFEIDANDVVTNIEFIGGCNGNLKAIPNLIDGWTAQQIAGKLLVTPVADAQPRVQTGWK